MDIVHEITFYKKSFKNSNITESYSIEELIDKHLNINLDIVLFSSANIMLRKIEVNIMYKHYIYRYESDIISIGNLINFNYNYGYIERLVDKRRRLYKIDKLML